MAINRLKVWEDGQVLTHTEQNNEFNNILDNPIDLWSPAAKSADMNGQELILDADADTSFTSDSDDVIDVRIGGVDSIFMGHGVGNTVGFLHVDPDQHGLRHTTGFSAESSCRLRH